MIAIHVLLRINVIIVWSILLQDVDTQNPTIEIKNTSEKFRNISNSLCSFMMYSDFLEASSSKNSTKLQALQTILQENIKDGCTLLKNQSATSNQVNFTTVQGIEGNAHNQTAECSGEDLESLRVHCLEQSLLQRFLKAPYYDVYRAISDIDCLNTKKGKCGWIERRFQEPERSIVVELADLSCSASK